MVVIMDTEFPTVHRFWSYLYALYENAYMWLCGLIGRPVGTIYVGNLPGDVRESEVEDLFHKVCKFV